MLDFIVTPFEISDFAKMKEAGASSVVIATPFFSARGVRTFTQDELPMVKAECSRWNLKMYCLVNRFFVEEELDMLRDHLKLLKQLDVDGIYYGDECVLYEAQRLEMKDKLIYNPDTLITNYHDVNYYLEEGISMVTISKEITLAEILEIGDHAIGECEVILHGRVNMMHSKRNLLSNYMQFIGKEEEVRNNHRLYLMEETRDDHMPIIEDDLGTHVFSGYTLASFEEINEMIQHGIRHFRIDGLFHDSSYVMEALRLYQQIISKEADGKEVFSAYQKRYENDHVTHGFYYTKTSKVKEG